MIDYNHDMGEVNLKDQFLHMYMFRVWGRQNGTSDFSKGYLTLQFSIRLLFIDKWREEIYSSSRIEFS